MSSLRRRQMADARPGSDERVALHLASEAAPASSRSVAVAAGASAVSIAMGRRLSAGALKLMR
jgi:hypothetical protein